jgi:hypothetical protein
LTRYPLAELLLVEVLLAEVLLTEVLLAEVLLAEVLLADGLLVEALQLKLRQPPLDLERRPRFPPPLGSIQELRTRLASRRRL